MYGTNFGSTFGNAGDSMPAPITGSAALTSPMPSTLWGYGAAVFPMPSVSSTTRILGVAAISAPQLAVSGRGGANAKLTGPTATATGAGRTTVVGSANLVAGRMTANGTGLVMVIAPGGTVTLPALKANGQGGANGRAVLPKPVRLSATGHAGLVARGWCVLPTPFTLSSGTVGIAAHGVAVSPTAKLGVTARGAAHLTPLYVVGTGSIVVTANNEAYFINLNHKAGVQNPTDEVTHASLPFIKVIRMKDDYYGIAADGLYKLGGATDNGTPVGWSFQLGLLGSSNAMLKTITSVVFGGRMGPETNVTLVAGEALDITYTYTTPRGDVAQNYRQPLGRGVRQRYLTIGAAGNAELALSSVTMDVVDMKRRI